MKICAKAWILFLMTKVIIGGKGDSILDDMLLDKTILCNTSF